MTRRTLGFVAVALALLLVVGCAVGQRLTASREDYRLYRETRIAENLLERLEASRRYLEAMPNGRFRPEVKAWFSEREPRFFRMAYDRPSLLKAYLRILPNGPHADEVADRLVEFDLLNEHRARIEARELGTARALQDRLKQAKAGRDELLNAVTSYSRLFVAIPFGQPTTELDHELIYRFRLAPPRGHCGTDQCLKAFGVDYAIPEGQELSPRQAWLDISLGLEAGLVSRATLQGPELFSRLSEAVELRPVRPNDLSARVEAIATAVRVLENALEPVLPAAECQKQPVAPLVLARACRGVRLTARAGTSPADDDRIDVVPLSVPDDEPPPSP